MHRSGFNNILEIRLNQLELQQNSGCPDGSKCLLARQWLSGKCHWRNKMMVMVRQGRATRLAVEALFDSLRQNQESKCTLGLGTNALEGYCCPSGNNCYFAKNLPRPLLHDQCSPIQRCVEKKGAQASCQKSECTTSATCQNSQKPICSVEERTCFACKLNSECEKKSKKVAGYNKKICSNGNCFECSATADCSAGYKCTDGVCTGKKLTCTGFIWQAGNEPELKTSINFEGIRLVCHFHFRIGNTKARSLKCTKGKQFNQQELENEKHVDIPEDHPLQMLFKACKKAVGSNKWTIKDFFNIQSPSRQVDTTFSPTEMKAIFNTPIKK